jgi:predicted Zn-dependent peptidase
MQRFRPIIALFFILQGILMSAQKETVTINNHEVPLIYEKSALLPIVSMQLVFQASGSVMDDTLPGIARITSMMLNEGTKKMGSAAFADALESRAIELRASHGRETFVFNLDSLKEEFDTGTELLRALLQDPNLTEETLGQVRTKLLGSIKNKESDFDYTASRRLYENIFKNTPIEHPSLGSEASVVKIKLEDVRAFIANKLILENAIVVIGGDLETAEAKKIAAKILTVLPRGTKSELPFYHAAQAKDVTLKKETEQAYVYFGTPFFAKTTDADDFKAKVASFILGSSGFGSRLMEEVRVKRGLAYSAYARINLALSHSYFSGHLQTKIENQAEAMKVVREEIEKFVDKGVTQKELESAKKFLLGSEPLRSETLSQRLGRSFNDFYQGKPLNHSKDELIRIEAMTLDELNQYIKIHPEIKKLTFSILTK